MIKGHQDPVLPALEENNERVDLTEDWGHAHPLVEEDQRVYMPSSQLYSNGRESESEFAYEEGNSFAAQKEKYLNKLKDGLGQAKSAVESFDKDQALERGRELIIAYPWPATLATFALGALLGHKIFRGS